MRVSILKAFIFLQILPDCPIPFSGKVKQLIKAEATSLDVILHAEALLTFIAFGERIQKAVEEATAEKGGTATDSLSVSSVSSLDSISATKGRTRRVSKQCKLFRLKFPE